METLASLAAALYRAAVQASVDARKVIGESAKSVKAEAKKNVLASAPRHNAHAHNAISYDTYQPSGVLNPWAEIGYDKTLKPGRLGNILEYGTGDQPGHRDLGRALDAEAPRFEAAISTIVARFD